MPDQSSKLHGLDPGELLARAMQTVRGTGGANWVPPDPEDLGRLLPQYRIESLLGHGGMGAVYKGWQVTLERPVAIKLLPAEVAAEEGFAPRFTREARTLARLQHPGIVSVHDFGQTSAGHLYFVMEYVEGTDLQRILRGPGLQPEQALMLIAEICEALHYAHAQGVIHRDIKPANILITQTGHAKVADFGLARPAKGEETELTGANVIMGTPDYMAPEQRAGHADHRADIFALGVMLYEMLTGQLPRGAFPPASRRVHVDVRIDEVVLKALQQEPERRYQDASEMKTDVDRISTEPPPGKTKAKRSWWLVPVSVATAVMMISGTVVLLWPKPAAKQRDMTPVQTAPDAAPERPFVNTLGMEFVPVPGTDVLFCTTITRVKDFRAFVETSGYSNADQSRKLDMSTGEQVEGGSWKDPGFTQTDEHPVVFVNYQDAQAFCQWLSRKEGRKYRLPKDHEWSCAVGIGAMEDAAKFPFEKAGKIGVHYFWGTQWPPPPGTGNFADETFFEQTTGWASSVFREPDNILRGYRDGYVMTSPVRQFKPNALGIYDLGGNASQLCEDFFDPTRRKERTWRGAPWGFGTKSRLLASYRGTQNNTRTPGQSFRCVLEKEAPASQASLVTPTRLPAPVTKITKTVEQPASATQEMPFANSLGMRFVPVPIAGGPSGGQRVLFSIWETRVQDYAEFVKESPRKWLKPGFDQGALHPVVMVDWEDANAFCAWLTARERRAGKIGENEVYRLPTDHEWSCAAGIGAQEAPAMLPANKHTRLSGYTWGPQWPPPPGGGNYADESGHAANIRKEYIVGYDDGYARTAPVGSFLPNFLGIFDLGGNAQEWCADEFGSPDEPGERVIRGSSWMDPNGFGARSSYRERAVPTIRSDRNGFRIVLAPQAVDTVKSTPSPSVITAMRQIVDVDFARDLSGYPILDTPEWVTGKLGDEYQMVSCRPGLWWIGQPVLQNLRLTDFVCEIQARIVRASPNDGWGLGLITGSGTSHPWTGILINGAGKVSSHSYDTGPDLPFETAGLMKPVDQLNTLRVEATGRRVRVFINGGFVFEREHERLTPDSALAIFCLGGDPPQDVRLRSIKVWAP